MEDTAFPPALGTFVHQEHEFKASPARVYEALLDARQFAEFSGAPAEIDRETGGSFNLVRGRVTGRNVELIPNLRIVQAWPVVPLEPGVYSIVRFEQRRCSAGEASIRGGHSGI